MKKILMIITIITYCNLHSQKLTSKSLNKLSELNIQYSNFDTNDLKIQTDFNKILKLDRKRKTNKTFGVIFSSISVVGIITGSIMRYQGNKIKEGHNFQGVLGALMIGSGVVYGGISVPFWICKKKRRKERDLLLLKYKR